MTLTLTHQQQWAAEAGATLATIGNEHNLQWRIGPETKPAVKAYYVHGEDRPEIALLMAVLTTVLSVDAHDPTLRCISSQVCWS